MTASTPSLRALVIGGGFSGMSAAIVMARRGAAVDLVEINAGWRSCGAGTAWAGPRCASFARWASLVGFLAHGAAADWLELYTPHGRSIGQLPTPRLAGPKCPAAAPSCDRCSRG